MSLFAGKSVLVVDDEADLRDILRDELEVLGFTVFDAENGMAAFALLATCKVDIIVSDIQMPGGSGIDLLDKLNAVKVGIPVLLFVTGYSVITSYEAYDKGAAGILAKPFDIELLVAHIQRMLLPLSKRWERTSDRLTAALTAKFQIANMQEAIAGQILNIGRGGMFVSMPDDVPVIGQLLEFEIRLAKESAEIIHGNGMVRWVRGHDEGPLKRGFGLEFFELEPNSRRLVLELIATIQPRAYIPAR
jgi:CheY-like chemotaxis protein